MAVFSCAEDLPLAVLLLFCSEGDNIPDAFALVNHLNDWLHLLDSQVSLKLDFLLSLQASNQKQKFYLFIFFQSEEPNSKWKIPTSWSLLFGSGIPPALF